MTKEEQIVEILNNTLSAHGWYSNTVIEGQEKAAKEIIKLFDIPNNTTSICERCGSGKSYKKSGICYKCLLEIYDEHNK